MHALLPADQQADVFRVLESAERATNRVVFTGEALVRSPGYVELRVDCFARLAGSLTTHTRLHQISLHRQW